MAWRQTQFSGKQIYFEDLFLKHRHIDSSLYMGKVAWQSWQVGEQSPPVIPTGVYVGALYFVAGNQHDWQLDHTELRWKRRGATCMPSCRCATRALENKTFMPSLATGSVSAVLAASGLPCWWQSTSGYFRELHACWAAELNRSLGDACSLEFGHDWSQGEGNSVVCFGS